MGMHRGEPAPSYRALLEIPTIGRILLGMALSRIGGSMLGVALVLFHARTVLVAGPGRARHGCQRRSRAADLPDRRGAPRSPRPNPSDHPRPASGRRVAR